MPHTKPFLLLGLTLLFLAGCTHYEWINLSGNNSNFGPDNYDCKRESLAAAPPAYQTFAPSPSHGEPNIVKTDCIRDKNEEHCKARVISRQYAPAPRTLDLNENLRDDMYKSCMQSKGWILHAVEDPE